jgi:5-methylcytosine-specific restriction endonuclease McrA
VALSAADRRLVRARAAGRCEYCCMAEAWEPFFPYHVEHIMALQHGGDDTTENLAFACHHCNLIKGRIWPALTLTPGR